METKADTADFKFIFDVIVIEQKLKIRGLLWEKRSILAGIVKSCLLPL